MSNSKKEEMIIEKESKIDVIREIIAEYLLQLTLAVFPKRSRIELILAIYPLLKVWRDRAFEALSPRLQEKIKKENL